MIRPVARIFWSGVTWMSDLYVRMQPRLGVRRFEIASEAILGQKQSRSSYTWSAEHCMQFLPVSYPCMGVTKSADIKF